MLRDCIKNLIFRALNDDIFRYEDFTVDETDDYENTLYIQYNDYYFRMVFDSDYCEITYSPGKIFIEETDELKILNFEYYIVTKIKEWLNRIKSEMLNPIEKRFIDDSIQKFREEMDSKLSEVDDGYFTNEEGNELREKLEQLENLILERDSQKEMQSEIVKMKEEIEFLKATINTLTKRKWFKNALMKMWSWGQKEENRKLIESGVEAVKAISQMDIPKI